MSEEVRLVDPSKLAGAYELAKLLGVTPSTISTWTERKNGIPDPVAKLACGSVWYAPDVLEWHKTYVPRKGGPRTGTKRWGPQTRPSRSAQQLRDA